MLVQLMLMVGTRVASLHEGGVARDQNDACLTAGRLQHTRTPARLVTAGCDANCEIPSQNATLQQLWECRVSGLPDLNQSHPYVRQQLAAWVHAMQTQYRSAGWESGGHQKARACCSALTNLPCVQPCCAHPGLLAALNHLLDWKYAWC